jgi:hypothetical protein
MREIDTTALKEIAFFDQSRNAATTFRAIPAVGTKRLAVERFQFTNDAGLQAREIGFEERGINRHLGRLMNAW